MLGRLHDGRVPAEDRRERLPGDVRQGRVEAHDQRRDAERLAHRQHRPVGHARRRRAAVRAAPLACDEQPHLHCRIGLAERERRAASPSPRRRSRRPPHGARGGAARAHGRRPRARPAVRSAHAGWAARAAATASSTSSAPDRATRQSGVSSAGRIFSSHSPERAGASRPSMRFVDARRDYQADQPPSTTTFEPVTYDEASDARKTTAPSASRASSMRPIGERDANASRNSGGWSFSHAAQRERVHAHARPSPSRSRGTG